MFNKTLIFAFLIVATGCSKKTQNPDFSDDYVLIEFAAKLEEDHLRIYPEPLENLSQKQAE
jgi:hypothetical protein